MKNVLTNMMLEPCPFKLIYYILHGIGLLAYLIPGIIAYALDFNNGTIYLPGTAQGSRVLQDIKKKLGIE